jgi:beta-galactosidase
MVYLCASYLCASKSGKTSDALGDTQQLVGEETWNWPDHTPLTVSCYTNCPKVTLFLNGQLLGTKDRAENVAGAFNWQLPFARGVLKAVGQKDGRDLCEFTLQTAGPANRIELHPDKMRLRADGQDISLVEFDVVDENGVRNPDVKCELTFELSGPARILGIGNGDITNCETVNAPVHRVFQGRGLMVVQTVQDRGTITLKASAVGLLPGTTMLTSR